ncbi:hypothetical protein NLX83_13100 [Allokutzneria sp. A3M-2-11 16]|uniref:hypothetical protein n=1 Tax=Allokutzneria sp. A3M-2-11 16 TaxID=2962043 RepID=UPI0020B779EC|nr:hypothetical protein [Allokutzneria sp. A3M-2-11 16]MCP3800196.1 hypothetical protein [Allokutzneria sp. A3M-2-11 16]
MHIVFLTKQAIHAALRARLSGSGVLVAWADPADKARRRSVWFTETVEPDVEPTGMVPGRRKPSVLTADVTIRAICVAPGDPVHAERGVWELRDQVDAAVMEEFDPGTVPGLIDVRPVRAVVTGGESFLGTTAQCDYTVRVRARLLT